jgi:hypothetical protein
MPPAEDHDDFPALVRHYPDIEPLFGELGGDHQKMVRPPL